MKDKEVNATLRYVARLNSAVNGNRFTSTNLPEDLYNFVHKTDGTMQGVVENLTPEMDYEIEISIRSANCEPKKTESVTAVRVTKEKDVIFNDLASSTGTNESSKVYTVTEIRTGETEIVVEKRIIERFPIQEYDNVIDLYERLNCGGGRKVFKLEELAHKHNPKNFE
jgi:hypothetical protein